MRVARLGSRVQMRSALVLEVKRPYRLPPTPVSLAQIWQLGFPHAQLPAEVRQWRRKNLPNLWRGLWREALARMFHVAHFTGTLQLAHVFPDGQVVDFGLASLRVITTVGVNAVSDAFQGTFTLSNFKFHGLGTGTAAEAAADTTLGTELTTQYTTNNTRATGTQTEGDGTGGTGTALAHVYRTVGENILDEAVTALTEWGLFSQAAAPGGTLFDRALFTAQSPSAGMTVKSIYDLTIQGS